MDKSNRALSLAEDNAAQLNDVSRRLRSRTRAYRIAGKPVVDGDMTYTSFGTVKASGDTAVTVAFDGGACSLMLGGSVIADGGSPMFAAVTQGEGELVLGGERANARALIFGAATIAQQ